MLDGESEDVQAKLEELTRQVRGQAYELEDLRAEKGFREAMHHALSAQKEEQIAQLNLRLQSNPHIALSRELEGRLEAAETTIAGLRKKRTKNGRGCSCGKKTPPELISVLQTALSNEEAALSTMIDRVKSLEAEVDRYETTLARLRIENGELERTNEKILNALDAAKSEETSLRAQLREEVRAKTLLEARLARLGREGPDSEGRVERVEAEATELRAEVVGLRAEAAGLRRGLAECRLELEAERRAREEETQELVRRVELLRGQLKAANDLFELRRKPLEEIEREHQREVARLSLAFEERISQLSQKIEGRASPSPPQLRLQIEGFSELGEEDRLNDIRSMEFLPRSVDPGSPPEPAKPLEQDSLLADYEVLLAELDRKNEELHQVRKELIELRDRFTDLPARLQDAQLQLKHLREQKELEESRQRTQAERQTRRIDELTREVVDLKRKFSELMFEKDSEAQLSKRAIRKLEGVVAIYEQRIREFNQKTVRHT